MAVDWGSTVHEILLPTEAPELEQPDPWICPASNLTQFFDVPLPPADLEEAMLEYGDEYREQCTITGRAAILGCFPSKEYWCQITTAAAPGALVDYLSYGSAASSWWEEHSSSAVKLASQCPDNWYNAMFDLPGGATWLNLTLIFGACYADAVATTGSELSLSTLSTASSTPMPGSSGMSQSATTTPTPDPDSGVVGRDATRGLWAVTGVAAAVAANIGFC
ncbi:hypothetical protein ACRALDRAFT_211175 [Sodiomyces alcalophilus JCM 7366]|uniref:uncharacterized protein n=1 Tax=Sodiomyces alcalophilus JCM 7366 TaxID=591952 RepID=UPI0039B65801